MSMRAQAVKPTPTSLPQPRFRITRAWPPAAGALAFAVAAFGPALVGSCQEVIGTVRVDVIELLAGRSVAGLQNHAVTHQGWTYLFASDEHARQFELNPEPLAVQLGGACARMGPLSGLGRPEIHAVHDGKLYFFASQSCKTTFEKHSESLLESPDARPTPTPEQVAQGRTILQHALAHHLPQGPDHLATFTEHTSERVRSGESEYAHRTSRIADANGRFRFEDAWNDRVWSHVVSGERGVFKDSNDPNGGRPMVASQVAAARREHSSSFLSMLRTAGQPETLVWSAGTATIGAAELELVGLWADGVGTVLGIEPNSGRVLQSRGISRGGRSGFVAAVERRYSSWKTIDGIVLPMATTTVHDGDEANATTTVLDQVEINPALDNTAFALD